MIADPATRDDWIKNRNMKALSFYRGLDGIDLIIDSPVHLPDAEDIRQLQLIRSLQEQSDT